MQLARISSVLLFLATNSLAGSALAGSSTDTIRLFGRDPGDSSAHACFKRHYDKAHLASHPEQNTTDMLVYVTKQDGTSVYSTVNMQVSFRHIRKPFQVSGGCSEDTEGNHALNCGVECDGGSLSLRVKNENSILVEIPEQVRIFDPSDDGSGDEGDDGSLPENARFGPDDKLFRLDRTVLKDCLPVIYDDEINAKVAKGDIKQ